MVHAQTSHSGEALPDDVFYNYIEDQKLDSSMYTRQDDMRTVDTDLYIEITDDDELVTTNENFELYLNEATLNFKIKNLHTGYVFSTAVDDADAGQLSGFLSSGVGLEYVNKERNMSYNSNVGIIDTEFELDKTPIENGIALDISVGGYCSTRNCSRLYDSYLDGTIDLDQMIDLGLTEINASFRLEVTLESGGLHAYIPYESITETETDWTVLSSIILFPGFGATTMDDIPGYMVIPDGVGTLMRYEDNEDQFSTPFEARFYGQNIGLPSFRQSVTSYPLSMPLFGAVHGVDQNAFSAIIESGDVSARLMAYPNGASNLDYNLIFPKFDIRQIYRQSFTSDGSGGATRVAKTMTQDISVQYNLLEGDDANYVGIAKSYRDYLKTTEVINPLENLEEAIPAHFQYLMSDSQNRFIGTSLIEMSDVDSVNSMYQHFMDAGIENQSVSLMGWNKGGYSGHLPSPVNFENSLGRNNDFRSLINTINEENTVYLLNDYVHASNATRNISYRNDVAQGVDRFQLEETCTNCVYNQDYMLYPKASLRLANNHYDDYVDEGVHVLFEHSASNIFSYYDSEIYMRQDALAYYEQIMQKYEGMSGYMYPNAYAYQYTNDFFFMPVYNSQLNYFDDLVPLIPIVLSGHMELYSQFLNYNALGREQTLKLIDFNINPAYILSSERSSELRGSDIEHHFSTHFDKWEDSVIEDYNFINEALKHVRGETIEARHVLKSGVVSVTYSNDVTITLNYTSQVVEVDGLNINPYEYHVGGIES